MMIVVHSSTAIDVPIDQAGRQWSDFVRQRLSDRNFVPDEWLVKDNACGVLGSGEVAFEPVDAARTRVTLSVELDLAPSDPAAGPEVEDIRRRVAAHLGRYRDFAEMR
jgi:hypothetical protein